MPAKKINLDQLDYQIISALRENARVSAAEIARLTGSRERNIRNRIDQLVNSGVVRLTAVMNPQTFGYTTAADIFIEIDPAREEEIIAWLRAMPEVTYIAFGFGSGEISLEARFKSNEDLRAFLNRQLPEKNGVTVARYTLVPRIIRNIDEWMPSAEEFNAVDE